MLWNIKVLKQRPSIPHHGEICDVVIYFLKEKLSLNENLLHTRRRRRRVKKETEGIFKREIFQFIE